MTKEERAALKKRLDELGLQVSAICGDLGGHGFQDAAGNPERIRLSKQIIDICGDFNTHVMTTHIGIVPTREESPVYQTMLAAAREVAAYAAAHDVTLAIETGPEPADRLRKFIENAGGRGIGVNLDPANLAMVLNVKPEEAVPVLAKYIVHTHAKDGLHLRDCNPADVYGSMDTFDLTPPEQQTKGDGPAFREVALGQGQVDWDAYLNALKAAGYNGFLTIEREVGDDPKADITMAVDFLKAHKIS